MLKNVLLSSTCAIYAANFFYISLRWSMVGVLVDDWKSMLWRYVLNALSVTSTVPRYLELNRPSILILTWQELTILSQGQQYVASPF